MPLRRAGEISTAAAKPIGQADRPLRRCQVRAGSSDGAANQVSHCPKSLSASAALTSPLPQGLCTTPANAAAPGRQRSPTAAARRPPQPTVQTVSASAACDAKYTGEPISVNLKDVDLKDFFRLIHEISGLNVVLDPSVHGTVTLVLDEVPWDQALDIVLRNNGLPRNSTATCCASPRRTR